MVSPIAIVGGETVVERLTKSIVLSGLQIAEVIIPKPLNQLWPFDR
jgi:hypothetical protein